MNKDVAQYDKRNVTVTGAFLDMAATKFVGSLASLLRRRRRRPPSPPVLNFLTSKRHRH
jgi:hypothetical protein